MIWSSKKSLLSALKYRNRRRMGDALRQSFDQLCVSIDQAADMLNLSRAKVYEMISHGEFCQVVRFGKNVRVRVATLEEWLIAREEAQQSS